MQRALELAARGRGSVSPNPCVGCVVVKNGRIVGEGYHHRYGGPHAEILALKEAGPNAKGATLYVTLEPCTHWGKTPPCAPEVAHSGVKQIFIAMKDPNPIVSGKGVRALQQAGLRVRVGTQKAAAENLNRGFVTWMTKKRPHVIFKIAMTLDGKIATRTGDSKWISNDASRRLVHKLRAESDAVLIGSRTALTDKPSLTSHGAGRNPMRFVVTSSGRSGRGKRLSARQILHELARHNVSQLLLEGGGETAWPFIKENLIDEMYVFIAPKIVGGKTAPTPVGGTGFAKIQQALKLNSISVTRIGDDMLVHGFNKAA